VNEAACISIPDDIKGESIVIYIVLNINSNEEE